MKIGKEEQALNRIIRFETTKRKLDWIGEEELRQGRRKEQQRRENRKINRENKWGDTIDE